jgi:hypothetical protein
MLNIRACCILHAQLLTPMKKITQFKSFLIGCFFITSCKDIYTICDLSKDVRFIAGFYQKSGAVDVVASAASLTIIDYATGAAIYSNQQNVTSFALPLNPQVDSAKYIITIAGNLPKDTVTLVYTSQGVNLSLECGTVTYHTLSKIRTTINTIDSIKIMVL